MTGAWKFLRPKFWVFGLLTLVPFLIGLVDAFAEGVGFVLLILSIPLAFLVLVAVTGLWFVRGITHARHTRGWSEKAIAVLASPLLFVSAVLLAGPLLREGNNLGDLARLAINQDRYEVIIEEARAEPKAVWHEEHSGVTYSVDIGPPVRVAFNPAGILDNWSGIVFDPTGEVMLAKGFDPISGELAGPARITELFGGDLVGCRHLWDRYYKCSFT